MFDPAFALILFTAVMLVLALAEVTVLVFGITLASVRLFLFNRRNPAPNPEDRIAS